DIAHQELQESVRALVPAFQEDARMQIVEIGGGVHGPVEEDRAIVAVADDVDQAADGESVVGGGGSGGPESRRSDQHCAPSAPDETPESFAVLHRSSLRL